MENLPNPQSRIEELLNAFISGDTDNIVEPQSRIEDFWYFLIKGTNSLPIPQSRTEELMKKIIENDDKSIPLAYSRTEEFLIAMLTGEIDNLSKPESRKEEYLNYIARHNLIVGNIEYVTYKGTNIVAQNTVKQPFKSAILKGNTLVNLFDIDSISTINGGSGNQNNDGWITFTNDGNINSQTMYYNSLSQNIKIGEKYIAFLYIDKNTIGDVSIEAPHAGYYLSPMKFDTISTIGIYVSKPFIANFSGGNTKEKTINFRCITRSTTVGELKFRMIILPYQDNMENWDIPYFEGMQSVKMPVLNSYNWKQLFDGQMLDGITLGGSGGEVGRADRSTSSFIEIEPSTQYTIANVDVKVVLVYDSNKVVIQQVSASGTATFTTNSSAKYVRFSCTKQDKYDIKMVEGTEVPVGEHKTNILSIDGEYRGIGDVCDTVDCMTGEVVERIGEIVLDGSQNLNIQFNTNSQQPNTAFVQYIDSRFEKGEAISCDLLKAKGDLWGVSSYDNQFVFNYLYYSENNKKIQVLIPYSMLKSIDVSGVKQFLAENPIKILFPIKESIKTVDLSIVDQDNNKVDKLSAFNDVTHIVSSSENGSLLAEVEVSVPTKMLESLNEVKTALADVKVESDIVGTAQKIQDVNSLNTMVALTEVYELALKIGDETK